MLQAAPMSQRVKVQMLLTALIASGVKLFVINPDLRSRYPDFNSQLWASVPHHLHLVAATVGALELGAEVVRSYGVNVPLPSEMIGNGCRAAASCVGSVRNFLVSNTPSFSSPHPAGGHH